MKLGAWTEEERAFVQMQWERMEDAELVVALNRPMSGVAMARSAASTAPRACSAPAFATRPTTSPEYGERTSSHSPVSIHSPSTSSFRSATVVATPQV